MSALVAPPSSATPVGKALLAIDSVTDEGGAAATAAAAAGLVNKADVNILFQVNKILRVLSKFYGA
jgi:hypothetical protein